MKNEDFVKSIYPNAIIQTTFFGLRVCSEPTINGRWVGSSFNENSKRPWKNAAYALRKQMIKILES